MISTRIDKLVSEMQYQIADSVYIEYITLELGQTTTKKKYEEIRNFGLFLINLFKYFCIFMKFQSLHNNFLICSSFL